MKLAETCVKYPVFTVMLIAFLVTLGAFSYRGLAVDLFPKADPATINVKEWLGRENAAITVMPRAGETLYRLKKSFAS